MKSSWIGIGFSHHSVPSLSNAATRSATGNRGTRSGGVLDEPEDRIPGATGAPAQQRLTYDDLQNLTPTPACPQ